MKDLKHREEISILGCTPARKQTMPSVALAILAILIFASSTYAMPYVQAAEPQVSVVKNPPAARTDPAMAYDAADRSVLLFGGRSSTGDMSDTWTFKAGVWTQVFPPTHPSARENGMMVWDAADGYVLLFGGFCCAGGAPGGLGDTWMFKGGVWTQLFPATPPPVRCCAAIAYDARDGYVVMFGGCCAPVDKLLRDTWKFSGGQWTQLFPPSSPPARWQDRATFDARDNYVLLFGGLNQAGTPLNDTWKFVAINWHRVSTIGDPSARWGEVITYDVRDKYVVLFGGATIFGGCPCLNDTWAYIGGNWLRLSPLGSSPSVRKSAGSTFDTADRYLVMFGGGNTSGLLGDTWTFHAEAWIAT